MRGGVCDPCRYSSPGRQVRSAIGLYTEIGQEIICSGSKDAMERIKAEGRKLWQAEWNFSTKNRTTFFKDIVGRMDATWIHLDH